MFFSREVPVHVRGTLPARYRKRREQGSDHMGYSRLANHMREERKKESEGQINSYYQR